MATTTLPETTYNSIVHRKAKGSLILNSKALYFRPLSGDAHPLPWTSIAKHQVSPATHPKSLLKVICNSTTNTGNDDTTKKKSVVAYTFEFTDRSSLEGARRDISARLGKKKSTSSGNKKRPRDNTNDVSDILKRQSSPPSSHYINLDPVALVATRSSLLASDPALRAQHRLLVLDGGTLSEDDFWETHSRLIANEYAKISGKTNKGMSSDIKSSLDLGISSTSKSKKAEGGGASGIGGRGGIVHLGVEEMRQIFIMYPAVHRAYEEKVPLELSEEQFWRKYLESEYFHRDRGRIGAHVGAQAEREMKEQERIFGKRGSRKDDDDMDKNGKKLTEKEKKKKENEGIEREDAKNRLAAAQSADFFSWYENNKGGQSAHQHRHHHHKHHQHHQNKKFGTQLAVGQFDLASTAEGERGEKLLGKDLHPPPEKGSAGARVIDKYNRHWAIVLHPTESTAGVDLGKVASKSAKESTLSKDDDDDAKVNGGADREMRRLVGFADANENDADYARGVGDNDDDLLELHLSNVDVYSGKFGSSVKNSTSNETDAETQLRYAKFLAASMRSCTEHILKEKTAGKAKGFCNAPTLVKPLPDPKIGRGLLEALTKKMAADSQTEADVQHLADTLPEEFKTKLATFFRRSSELLRHFFSLRSVFNDNGDGNGGIGQSESQKKRLDGIVKGMEKVHGEMYELTRNLPLVESKMFKPIMDQLDWAFKLHREDSSKSKGGFVTVKTGGFVPVSTNV